MSKTPINAILKCKNFRKILSRTSFRWHNCLLSLLRAGGLRHVRDDWVYSFLFSHVRGDARLVIVSTLNVMQKWKIVIAWSLWKLITIVLLAIKVIKSFSNMKRDNNKTTYVWKQHFKCIKDFRRKSYIDSCCLRVVNSRLSWKKKQFVSFSPKESSDVKTLLIISNKALQTFH